MIELSPIQRSVLEFAEEHGDIIDFGGKGASKARLNAAKQLIHLGLMAGTYRSASITVAGIGLLLATLAPADRTTL